MSGHARLKRFPYRLRDGEITRTMRTDETINDEIDFYNVLGGEEISAVDIDACGPTFTNEAIANGRGTNSKVTFTITKTGSATFKLTTSGGQELEVPARWEPTTSNNTDYS